MEERQAKKRGVAAILIVLVLVGAFGGYVWYSNNEAKKVEIVASGFKSDHKKGTQTWACVIRNNSDRLLSFATVQITAYDKDGNVLKQQEKNRLIGQAQKILPGESVALAYDQKMEEYSEAGFETPPYKMDFKLSFTGLKWSNATFPYKLKITKAVYGGEYDGAHHFDVTVKNKGKKDFNQEDCSFSIVAVYKNKKGKVTGGTSYYCNEAIPAGKKATISVPVRKGSFDNYEFYLSYSAWGDLFHI